MAFECPFCNRVLSSRSAYSQHVKRCSENYDSSSSSSSEEIQNEFDIITSEQNDNSEDNRNNEIIYISDDEPMFSSRSNETSDIMQVEIDELPQSINSLTFEEFASIRYEEPTSREPEFETDESKSKSDETETETDSESKSDKTKFESDKTDNESDESEESESAEEETETIPKFPNNTYSDLMTLIIQHNLNNKARNAIIRFFNKPSNLPTSLLPKNIEQGRKLMDRIKLINLLNKEKIILKYNNKDYIIYYRPIINCIKNILSIKDIHKYITFNFKNDQTNNNRNYNEQYTSNWWAQTEKTLPTGSYLLSIILYSDASTIDSLGKNTLHPIFVTLGNIITWRRNKPDVKQLLAYLPIIKAKDDTQKISEEHKNIVRRTFHKSLKFLLSLLYDDNDNRNNEIIYISDDEPMFSSRSNETSDIMQVEIDELPQSINSLTFEEFASIRYEEPTSREPEFETDESKSKSDETETETDSESKSDKTKFESDKTDNESDESEESESAEEETETIPKFPNNTYSDLMTLIIQHNLNNKARNAIIRFFNKPSNLPTSLLPKNIEQGRKLMDRIKLINLLNKEKIILKYNNKDYIIYYRPIINCIKNILSIKDIHKYITFNFKNDQTNNNRNYNEQYTSNWWAQTEKTLPTGSYLLSIILYSDASTIDSLGKNTLHPIFVTLGNIITWRRNKPDVKQLLAYLPIIKAKDDTQKISEEHKNIVRRTFHKSLKFLLSLLYDDNGIELELNNSIFWCFSRISMIISDWPEACTFALTYKSTKSNYPVIFASFPRKIYQI
ncbi:hypothetical protein Glove_511g20 [Diversispora epigaea]|uniref:C2H2-type domain-containing protein n=1 Tax=Diversispora epigaea TaxID=1348612 RepID=A0A397GP79_9GLOM|nr:hypothetical protein Glove_511g20 [Diversispora epigaea]